MAGLSSKGIAKETRVNEFGAVGVYDFWSESLRLSAYYDLYCDEVDDTLGDANSDEADVATGEVYEIVLPVNCRGVVVTLEQCYTPLIYNNGTNSYALLPRTRGALVTIGAEDSVVAAERFAQNDNPPAVAVQDDEAVADVIYVPPNTPMPIGFAEADTLHAGFLRFDGDWKTNIGGAGGVGQIVVGGTTVINYIPARLHIRALYDA